MTTMVTSHNINSRMFNNYINKHNNPDDIVKIPRNVKKHNDIDTEKCLKAQKTKLRDSRYALKNRRTVNKYWKDFNNGL